MIIRRFLAYLGVATLGMAGVYGGGKALLFGAGDPLAWLELLLGVPTLIVGTLALGRILYLSERSRFHKEER
ncbi:MAG TPA: hypothetical protein ENI60_08070 [Candidatus Fraserbacteria bacterium]|nr:hypothetical protein [Candidatus Fraserbacteria bacterium]